MVLGEQENVFPFEFELIVQAILKCLFRHNFCRRSLPPAEYYPYLLIFILIKDFLDVYNVEQPGQTQNTY